MHRANCQCEGPEDDRPEPSNCPQSSSRGGRFMLILLPSTSDVEGVIGRGLSAEKHSNQPQASVAKISSCRF